MPIKLGRVKRFLLAKDVKKLIMANSQLCLQPWIDTIRIKKAPKSTFAFVRADNETEVLEAFRASNLMCGKNLVSVSYEKEKTPRAVSPPKGTPFELLSNQVTPLANIEYSEQLEIKRLDAKEVLNMDVEVYGSPIENGYRTKCEFTIGRDLDGQKTVGLNYGKFEFGVAVGSPVGLKIFSDTAVSLCLQVQEFVRNSEHTVYDRTSRKGFFRLLMVKTMTTGERMMVLQVNQTIEDIDALKSEFTKAFSFVESLGIQQHSGVADGFFGPVELLSGLETIQESLMGFTFSISPHSFFQSNTRASEVLYKLIGEYAKGLVLLDVCCGTGTIGIALSSMFKSVVGIEIVEQAVEDAKRNAQMNAVNNIEFVCGAVENVLGDILKQISEEVVVVLDPPRSGVKSSVIRAIRKCSLVKKLIYVSCDIRQAQTNIEELCKPSSQRYVNASFSATRAAVVDMFPHTRHKEVVVEFER